MFDKFRKVNSLKNLVKNKFDDTELLVNPTGNTKKKLENILSAIQTLENFKQDLSKEDQGNFETLITFVRILLTKGSAFSKEKEITVYSLNSLIASVYNSFQDIELKKRKVFDEIKKRLISFGIDGNIKVSKFHRISAGISSGVPLSLADFDSLSKHDKLIYFHGTEHPNRSWYHISGFVKGAYKAGLIEVTKYMNESMRILTLRMLGIYIGNNVSIGSNVQFDYFFPELIRIEDDVRIGNNVKLWTHDFSINSFGFAALTIHKGSTIEDDCLIGPVQIGSGILVKKGTIVLHDLMNIPGNIYDESDKYAEYMKYFDLDVSGKRYNKLKSAAINMFMKLCKVLPYDPVPRDVKWIGKLEIIQKMPAILIKNRLHKALGVKIKGNITSAPRVYFDAIHPELIEIEEGTLIGDGVTFRPYDVEGNPKPIKIGKFCKIGSESLVLGCEIGDYSMVQVRSVVTENLPGHCEAAGIPAKVIKTGFSTV